jgi:hypothetical protein
MAQKALTLVETVTLTAAAVSYYTAPANTTAQIDSIILNNTTATARTVKLHIVVSGGATTANEVVTRVLVPANGCVNVPQMALQTLEVGKSIFALCDAASAVNMRISGREIQ